MPKNSQGTMQLKDDLSSGKGIAESSGDQKHPTISQGLSQKSSTPSGNQFPQQTDLLKDSENPQKEPLKILQSVARNGHESSHKAAKSTPSDPNHKEDQVTSTQILAQITRKKIIWPQAT